MHLTVLAQKSMMVFFMLLLFGSAFSQAQVNTPVLIQSHGLSPSASPHIIQPATGSFKVVAVMAEFQPDSNRFTSGTGVFGEGGLPYLENNPDIRIEPLPHDRAYFEAHLEFLKNYFERSSGNQIQISFELLPDIIRLDDKMETYSPTGETFTNEPVARLARDVWTKVEENGAFDTSELDPERTAFVIFHAGVGRDIELTGTTLDRTPQDIPSLSLRQEDLAALLDEPGFDGFDINGGAFKITNSLIIPRTQSRRGEDIQGNEFVFPLSTNGLICASFGSFLGLPDLFDTETGEPAIGQFGLMDGAGIFSYNGLFPPEPSAWEKIRLGWQSPFPINSDSELTVELPASSLHQPNSIARYNLTGEEYFLIENRHRDPEGTGVTLTIQQPDGSLVNQTFTNQDITFANREAEFDTLLEAGVVVNVSNFDWSLPGGLDIGEDEEQGTSDDRELNGGMLIWHIDEAVIRANLTSQSVNNDENRRGVDLEEADGAQDIGRAIQSIFAGNENTGTPFDFWWSGNNSSVITQTDTISLYENRFAPDTEPNNDSNTGAISFFELRDFSENIPVSSFIAAPFEPQNVLITPSLNFELSGTSFFTPPNDYWDYYPLSLSIFETVTDTFLIIPEQNGVSALNLSNPANASRLTTVPPQQPLSTKVLVTGNNPQISINENQLTAHDWDSATETFDIIWTGMFNDNKGFLSSQNGDTVQVDFTSNAFLALTGTDVSNNFQQAQVSERIGNSFSRAAESFVEFPNSGISPFSAASPNLRLFTGIIRSQNQTFFYIFDEENFILVDPSSEDPFVRIFHETKAEWPAITDDLTFFRIDKEKNQLTGINRTGSVANFTPIDAPQEVEFTGTPLIADISAAEQGNEFLIAGYDSVSVNIYGYSSQGKRLPGFPLFVGSIVNPGAQLIHPFIYRNTLYAVSHTGTLKAWDFKENAGVEWAGRYGNNQFNKVSARINDALSTETPTFSVLNKNETYNWPNPAREETNIRFQVEPPGGEVTITIVNQSGQRIYERDVQARGSAPEEIKLNTSNWASGIYYAMVKATVSGNSESELIKMVVVH